MRESSFQSQLIRELESMFKGCVIFKTDPRYMQGFPDLMILYNDKWAALECKKKDGAHQQPNQSYYVEMLNKMSFSRFISPDNKKEVLDDLQRTFESGRPTCLPGSK